jgi:hypothetical protein
MLLDVVRDARAGPARDGRDRYAAAMQNRMDLPEPVRPAPRQQRPEDPRAPRLDARHAVGNRAQPRRAIALQQLERLGRGAADVEIQRGKSEPLALLAVARQHQPVVRQRRQPGPVLGAADPRLLRLHPVFGLARHQIRAATRLRDHHAPQPPAPAKFFRQPLPPELRREPPHRIGEQRDRDAQRQRQFDGLIARRPDDLQIAPRRGTGTEKRLHRIGAQQFAQEPGRIAGRIQEGFRRQRAEKTIGIVGVVHKNASLLHNSPPFSTVWKSFFHSVENFRTAGRSPGSCAGWCGGKARAGPPSGCGCRRSPQAPLPGSSFRSVERQAFGRGPAATGRRRGFADGPPRRSRSARRTSPGAVTTAASTTLRSSRMLPGHA